MLATWPARAIDTERSADHSQFGCGMGGNTQKKSVPHKCEEATLKKMRVGHFFKTIGFIDLKMDVPAKGARCSPPMYLVMVGKKE